MPNLLTAALRATLIANLAHRDADDTKPLVKFFTPDAQATWLICDMDSDGRMFGLCDLGLGFPEMGYVMLADLERLRGRLGLLVERDLRFTADGSLLDYANAARRAGRIVHPLPPETPDGGGGAALTPDAKPAKPGAATGAVHAAPGDLALLAWPLPNTLFTGPGARYRHELAYVTRCHDGTAVDFLGITGGVRPRKGSRAVNPPRGIEHVAIRSAGDLAPLTTMQILNALGDKAIGEKTDVLAALLGVLNAAAKPPAIIREPAPQPEPEPAPAPLPLPAPQPWPDPAKLPQPWPSIAERRSAAARKAIANRDRFAAGRKAAATRAARLAASAAPPAPPAFTDWLSERLGTRNWTPGPVDRRQRGAFDRVISPSWMAALRAAYARFVAANDGHGIARAA